MSEFLAEAQVLVRPITTGFRKELEAAVVAATRKPVLVPVTLVPSGISTTGLAALTTESGKATRALDEVAGANRAKAAADKIAAKEASAHARSLGEIRKGGVAAAAGLAGLRGAVLAASAPFLLATVGITAFSRAVQSAAELESTLNVFRVTAKATAEEMVAVREQAKLLGRDLTLPGITARDAAEAFLTLSKAGLTVEDSLAGARGVLQLAVAAQIGFADAAQLTASALNAFALSGDSAVDVADILTNAANASQASIGEMGIALRQSAAIADLVGFSLSETVTFLTQLAKAGLAGSDAGTSFRVSMQRLIAPTDDARSLLEKLNINLRDAQGNLRPEAFFELGDALERMGRAAGDAARQTIFGNDASRAAAFFARLNADSFRKQEKALIRAGAAAEVAGARNEGLEGKTENLKNQISALGVELGELATPAVGVAVDVLAFTFGTLATQVADTRKAFKENTEQVKDFLEAASQETGFTDFLADVSSGAKLLEGDLDRAAGAVEDFFGSLFGGGSAANTAASGVRRLTEEEIRLAKSLTDSHDRIDIQVQDLKNLRTAAQEAAGSIARLTGQIAGIEEQVTRARITGDEGAELNLLEQERERLQRLLAIEEKIVAEGGRGAATARQRIRQEILPQLESVNSEIRRIIEQQVTATEQLKNEAERARKERDQNILDAIGGEESRRTNAVIRAEATESLRDDLRAQTALRDFYRRSREEIRKTVRDAKTRAQAVLEATREIIRAEQEVDRIEKELTEQRRERRREARERRAESLQLDIDIAEATGNRSAEIRAREAEIKFIQRQIRQTREGSLQRKRLILELRQAQRDLRELKEETKKTKNEFAELAFEFLQTQQGFAANLLGNLIPGSATGGLVGNVSAAQGLAAPQFGPEAAVQGEAAIAGARDRGVRPGQVETTNQLLRAILRSLQNLNGRAGHPEARYQKATQSAFMDVIGT